MRPLLVVGHEPALGQGAHLRARFKDIRIEDLGAVAAIEALDVRILIGLARLDVLDRHATRSRTTRQRPRRAARDRCRRAPPPGGRAPRSVRRGHASRGRPESTCPPRSPGVYEIRILDKHLTARATTKGSADIRDFVTTLEAGIDASDLEPSDYQLTLRREGGEWQIFRCGCADRKTTIRSPPGSCARWRTRRCPCSRVRDVALPAG